MVDYRCAFLGAGFSIPLGLPTTHDLWCLGLEPSAGAIASGLLLADGQRNYPLRHFKANNIHDMELLLTTWDAYLETLASVYPGDTGLPNTYREHYIANLAYHIDERCTNLLEKQSAKDLISILRNMRSRIPLSVVTTNYDRVFERLLQQAGRRYTYNSGNDIGIPIYKPHGSVNWYEGQEGSRREDGWEAQPLHRLHDGAILNFELEPLPGIGEQPMPVIVPPTITKKYQGFLQLCLLRAGTALRSAQRVLFVGYSFPIADLVLERFVRDTFSGDRSEQEIVYVNPDAAAVARARELLPGHTDFQEESWSPAHFKWLVDDLGFPGDVPPPLPPTAEPPV
jgi:hypothetical protein